MAKLEDALIEIAPAANATTDNGNPHQVLGRKADTAVTTVGVVASIMAYIKGLLGLHSVPTADVSTNATMRDVVGNKFDAAATTVANTHSIIAYVKGLFSFYSTILNNTIKIDKYLSHTPQWYGYSSPDLVRGALTAFQSVAGSDAYSEEHMVYNATISDIISADNLRLSQINISAVGTADLLTYLQFREVTILTTVNATTQDSDDTIHQTSHGLSNGDMIYVSVVSNAFNAVRHLMYVVDGEIDSGYFKLSYTLGGAALTMSGGNGTITYHEVSVADLSEHYVSRKDAVPNTLTEPLLSRSIPTSHLITVRSKSVGATNTIDFFIGLLTFDD